MWIEVSTITHARDSKYVWIQVPMNGPRQTPWTGYGPTGIGRTEVYGGGGGTSNC